MNPKDFPQLNQGDLDDAALQSLVEDLTTLAEVLDVKVKGSHIQPRQPSKLTLEQAVHSLRAGQVRGVQVLYRWQNDQWIDTLTQADDQVRVIRMKLDPNP